MFVLWHVWGNSYMIDMTASLFFSITRMLHVRLEHHVEEANVHVI